MRKTPLVEGEYYHVFNRGVDKRIVFQDNKDLNRFFTSIEQFNTIDPIGSLYENSRTEWRSDRHKKLVEVVSYCLNPNHFHLLLRQVAKNGISEFMKRLSGGYTWYFNNKYKRSGSLFQGKFKSIHVGSDEYILHLSVYINLNNKMNKKGALSKSSWKEYLGEEPKSICNPDIVLKQFRNIEEYKEFALGSLQDILERKKLEKELQ